MYKNYFFIDTIFCPLCDIDVASYTSLFYVMTASFQIKTLSINS